MTIFIWFCAGNVSVRSNPKENDENSGDSVNLSQKNESRENRTEKRSSKLFESAKLNVERENWNFTLNLKIFVELNAMNSVRKSILGEKHRLERKELRSTRFELENSLRPRIENGRNPNETVRESLKRVGMKKLFEAKPKSTKMFGRLDEIFLFSNRKILLWNLKSFRINIFLERFCSTIAEENFGLDRLVEFRMKKNSFWTENFTGRRNQRESRQDSTNERKILVEKIIKSEKTTRKIDRIETNLQRRTSVLNDDRTSINQTDERTLIDFEIFQIDFQALNRSIRRVFFFD